MGCLPRPPRVAASRLIEAAGHETDMRIGAWAQAPRGSPRDRRPARPIARVASAAMTADEAAPEAVRRRPRRAAPGVRQLPWRRLVNPYRPIEILSTDHVETIHRASLRILAE